MCYFNFNATSRIIEDAPYSVTEDQARFVSAAIIKRNELNRCEIPFRHLDTRIPPYRERYSVLAELALEATATCECLQTHTFIIDDKLVKKNSDKQWNVESSRENASILSSLATESLEIQIRRVWNRARVSADKISTQIR